MTRPAHADAIELFLRGAEVVVAAIGDPAVEAAWDRPSVLADQQVGGLAGHLARGGVWAVGEYLASGEPTGPVDVASAGEYFAVFASGASADDHLAIRARGAALAAVGPAQLHATLVDRLDALRPDLRARPDDQLVAVIAGRVMRLADYLATRIVEQTVHLDDLARSVGREPWPVPTEASELTLAIGLDVGRRRRGDSAMLRALYRSGFGAEALPVL